MHDMSANGDAGENGLAWEALLYASGELETHRASAFEDRLANDQAAREALSLAAQMAIVPGADPSLRPGPAYRDAVRLRLKQGESVWQHLWGRRPYRGHPLLWGCAGAAAAVLLMVGLVRSGAVSACWIAPTPPVVQVPAPQIEDDSDFAPPTLEAASAWAEISQSDHLLKAHDDELRRKTRSEEWHRLMHPDARRTRTPHNPCYDEMR